MIYVWRSIGLESTVSDDSNFKVLIKILFMYNKVYLFFPNISWMNLKL